MNHIKYLLTMVMAIILCLGNVGAMEPEKQQSKMRTGNQNEDNTQRMVLKEHMKGLGIK